MARPRSRSRVTRRSLSRDGTVRPVGAHHHHTHGHAGQRPRASDERWFGNWRDHVYRREWHGERLCDLGEFTHRHERGHVPRDSTKAGDATHCRSRHRPPPSLWRRHRRRGDRQTPHHRPTCRPTPWRTDLGERVAHGARHDLPDFGWGECGRHCAGRRATSGTTVSVYPVIDAAPLVAEVPAGQSYVVSLVVAWQAPDGTSPVARRRSRCR